MAKLSKKVKIILCALIASCCAAGITLGVVLSRNNEGGITRVEHSINVEASEYAEVCADKATAKFNEVVHISVTNIKEGYELKEITANNRKIDNNSFIMPDEDVRKRR